MLLKVKASTNYIFNKEPKDIFLLGSSFFERMKNMRFGKNNFNNYNSSISKEYLLTNGIGGYSSASISGSNIRKYSALLIACLNPPTDRRLLLSKLDETLVINGNKYKLYTNEMVNGSIDEGYLNQQSFECNDFINLRYEIKGVFVDKKITMVYGENTTVINYTIRNNNKPISLKIEPLINNRDHHENTFKGDFECIQLLINKGVKIKYDINEIELNLVSDKARYIKSGKWIEGMFYKNEFERGLKDSEDHYIPGYFEIELAPKEIVNFSIIASTEVINEVDGEKYFKNEAKRKEDLLQGLKYRDKFTETLALACDQFIVKRKSTNTATVIAGYPWFTDWGRDTMIALPGLTLCTGRYEEGKEMLLTFAKYLKNGLVPNMFPDDGVEPIYNTIDGTLWYFNAIYKYLEYTKDYEFIEKNIFKHLTDILDHHIKGTDFKIKMDKDGLLAGGDKTLQLTWMDVKIKDWTVTPRQGKAVEINALWYNAIKVYIHLCKEFGLECTYYELLAEKVKASFIEKFWDEDQGYLYDYIDGEEKNKQIRPNAVIAISLPFKMVNEFMAKKIIELAFEKLYATYGLRSLAYDDEAYKKIYKGDLVSRDSAYHQGTVWSWLIGPFVSAISYWYRDKNLCKQLIEPFYDHLNDRGIGNISEVFDGDTPHNARACYAQAWGAAELLRAYVEHVVN